MFSVGGVESLYGMNEDLRTTCRSWFSMSTMRVLGINSTIRLGTQHLHMMGSLSNLRAYDLLIFNVLKIKFSLTIMENYCKAGFDHLDEFASTAFNFP